MFKIRQFFYPAHYLKVREVRERQGLPVSNPDDHQNVQIAFNLRRVEEKSYKPRTVYAVESYVS